MVDGASTFATIEPPPLLTAFERGRERILRSTPGWRFHLLLAVATLPLFWAASPPAGGNFLLTMASLWVLFLGALAWIARLIIWIAGRRPDRPRPHGRWFLMAPLCAVIVAGLFFADIPLQARWHHAKPALESITTDAPAARANGEPLEFNVPGRAGTYRLDGAVRVGDDVFISLARPSGSGFLVGAGFAYLPDGPDPAQLDPVSNFPMTYQHLAGNWYSWASYW